MCLEFLCSWCHQDEDGPEHHRTQSQHTGLSASPEPPSKPPFNGTEIRKGEYPARDKSPSIPHSEPSVNGTGTWKGDAFQASHELPSKPLWEAYDGIKNQFVNGVAVNGDTMRKGEHPKTSSMALNGEKILKAVNPGSNASVPHVGNNTVLAAPEHQPNLRRGANSNFAHTNGHPGSNASVPHVGNNTVLAAPVHPNLRRGANSNFAHTNGHYPTADHSGWRNGNMQKDEEEEEDEEEVPKVAQLKNRRYS